DREQVVVAEGQEDVLCDARSQILKRGPYRVRPDGAGVPRKGRDQRPVKVDLQPVVRRPNGGEIGRDDVTRRFGARGELVSALSIRASRPAVNGCSTEDANACEELAHSAVSLAEDPGRDPVNRLDREGIVAL